MDPQDLVINNLKFYDTIKPKNPPNSYTVLATLNDYETGQLLCLATGTQANLKSCDDDIQDCHAESLVKRAYKRYVIDALKHLLTSSSDTESLKKQIQSLIPKYVTLFVSKFPCGFLARYEGQEPVDPATGEVIKRKPGRGIEKNGKIVYVEKDNCMVKLQKWLKRGIQGNKLKQIFNIETHIKAIIIGNCETADDFDYHSHLEEFSSRLLADQSEVDIHHVDLVRRNDFIFRQTMIAQPVSVVWWHMISLGPNNNREMIVDGRRSGLTKQHRSGGLIESTARLKVADTLLRNDLEHISTIHMNSLELATNLS